MKKILYLGLTSPRIPLNGTIIHHPIICTIPRTSSDPSIQATFDMFAQFTHIVITSKTTLPLLFSFAKDYGISAETIVQKKLLAVGKATAGVAKLYGMEAEIPVDEENAEGMCKMMNRQNFSNAFLFWPHSALSRPILTAYFHRRAIRHCHCIFYDTIPNRTLPIPNVEAADEIIFTSPSTVDAYLELVGPIPWHKKITPIGPVTASYLIHLADNCKSNFNISFIPIIL